MNISDLGSWLTVQNSFWNFVLLVTLMKCVTLAYSRLKKFTDIFYAGKPPCCVNQFWNFKEKVEFILFSKSTARNRINFAPQTDATAFAMSSDTILLQGFCKGSIHEVKIQQNLVTGPFTVSVVNLVSMFFVTMRFVQILSILSSPPPSLTERAFWTAELRSAVLGTTVLWVISHSTVQ